MAGLNDTSFLKASLTVFDDAIADILTGGSERDWFFARRTGSTLTKDIVSDKASLEIVDVI